MRRGREHVSNGRKPGAALRALFIVDHVVFIAPVRACAGARARRSAGSPAMTAGAGGVRFTGKRLLLDLAEMSPAYFGVVMATGIISLAADLLVLPRIALALFVLNCGLYGVIGLLFLVRMVRFPQRFF